MSLSERFFGAAGGPLVRPSFRTLLPMAQTLTVLAAALLLRLFYWQLASTSPFLHTPVVDGSFFDMWARTLAEGRVFQAQAFFKPPLYAYLLAFLYRLGFGLTGVFVLQMVVGALGCALTLAVGRIVFAPRVAFAGALIAALLPILPFFECQLLAETWTTTLTLAALLPVLLAASGLTRPRGRLLALAGVLLGIAALGRPNLLLVLVICAGLLWWNGRRRIGPNGRPGAGPGVAPIVALVAGFLVAIAPATLHNLKYGEFALISANLGVNLYTGQSDTADGISAIPVGTLWDDIQLRTRQAGAGTPVASSRFLVRETLAWMAAHSGRTLELWGRKAVLLFSGYEGRNNINPLYLAREDGVFLLARWWPGTWLILPFAVVGLIWAGRGESAASLLRWLVVGQAVAILPFFVNARFRAPLLPLLALFAAAGAVVLLNAVRTRRWAVPAVLLLVLALGSGDWFGLGADRWLARDHFNLGLIHLRPYGDRQPDPATAALNFRRALALDPDDVDYNERFGALLLSQAQPLVAEGGNLERAGQAPAAAAAYNRAAALLAEAAPLHRRATEVFPRSFRSWGNLGTCRMWQGDVQSAQARAALAAGDQTAASRLALGALGSYQEAVDCLQMSLQVNQAQPEVRRQIPLIWPAVLDLPDLDPAIGRVQEQLRQRLGGGS